MVFATWMVRAASSDDNVQIAWQASGIMSMSFCVAHAAFVKQILRAWSIGVSICMACAAFGTLYTLHFALFTLHSTLFTCHSPLYTLHSTLYTSHFTLYTPYTLHIQLQILYAFTLYTPYFTFCTLHLAL